MSKHTPGPWEARPFDDDRRKNVCVTGSGQTIATVWTKTAANDADARLIAAAPEMLDALKKRDFEMNYIISQLLSCVERAEGLADGGPIAREAEKHVHAWRQRLSEIADDAIARAEGRDE